MSSPSFDVAGTAAGQRGAHVQRDQHDPGVALTGDEQVPPVVRVRSLRKQFRRGDGSVVPAVDDVSLDVRPGEFVVLLGPSGCGKTTLLRCIAGLEQPGGGAIDIHGTTVFSSEQGIMTPPERRRTSMIFQSYALWPHMSAFENVAYPLRSRKMGKADISERVKRVLELVGIPELVKQYPGQMSGGQQQRIALARAIVANDNLVLFDEPLSNVDAKVREQLRLELLSMQRELGFSAVYVTHDQTEAMELAHRIAVMRNGRIVQIGSPRAVYERPLTRYVANFIGTTNEIPGRVASSGHPEHVIVKTDIGELTAAPGPSVGHGDEVVVVFRPERCIFSQSEPGGPNRWRGVVQAAMFLGSHTEHVVRVEGHTFRLWRPDSDLLEPGTEVWLSVPPEHLRALPADAGPLDEPCDT